MDDAKSRVKEQYGSVGDAYVKSAGHASGNALDRMVELADLRGDERMLDIATGGGHVARHFAPRVREVVATDLTPGILRHAEAAFREWGLNNVSVAEADAEELPFDEGSFDIVTCRIAPHHFPHPEVFVHEAARVLRPNGRFLLVDSTVPDGVSGEFFNHFEQVRDYSHVRSLTIEEWLNLIVETGMSLMYTESFRKRHDFSDWVARSRTSASDIAELNSMMQSATADVIREYEVEFGDAGVRAFVDTKTLFVARKSGE